MEWLRTKYSLDRGCAGTYDLNLIVLWTVFFAIAHIFTVLLECLVARYEAVGEQSI